MISSPTCTSTLRAGQSALLSNDQSTDKSCRYDDNDASKPSAGGASAAAAPAPVEPKTEGAGDSSMKQHEQDEEEEEEDDDDDVDFNLGGDAGSTSITHNMPKEEPQPEPAYEQPRSPGQYGSVHKASAKDEG